MKKLLLLTAITSLSTSAIAENGVSTKLEGMFNFESGSRNQSKVPAGTSKNVSANRKNFAFDTEANFTATVSNTIDCLTYGARLGVQTSAKNTSSAAYNGSHLFVTSNYGKWELGAGFDANTQMGVSAMDIARGSGDHWERYWYAPDTEFVGNVTSDNNAPDNFTDYGTENSRNITYFTPVIKDFIQFGITYTPDTSNVGVGGFSKDYTPSSKTRALEVGTNTYSDSQSYKDLIAYGVALTHHLADNTDIKVTFTGETGKSAKRGVVFATADATKTSISTYKLSNLKRYNFGAVLDHNNWSFAGSYATQKGYTNQEINQGRNKSHFYTAGTAYKAGPAAVSFVYSVGNNLKNKVSSYTLGTDYKLAPGFVPYVEVTYFQAKGKKLPILNDNTTYKTKGTIALIGATLKF